MLRVVQAENSMIQRLGILFAKATSNEDECLA